MEQNNFDIKKVLSITCYILLLFVSVQTFVTISSLVSMDTYQIKGYSLVAFSFLFFIYSIFTNNKLTYYLSSLFIIAGYTYTFYTIYKVYDSSLSFKTGFYLYIFSFILFIITLLLKSDKTVKPEQNNVVKEINKNSKTNIVEDNYMIGTYLYGIKEMQEFSNHSCAITTNGNSKDLIIILTSNTTLNYEIKYNQIEKITVKQGMSINHNSTKLVDDYKTEKMILGYALANIWGSMIAEKISSPSDKVSYSVEFTVEIMYKVGEESKKIVMEFPKNPDSFFRNYEGLYEKIS